MSVLSDGTYLSVLINPAIRGARRRAAILAAAGARAAGHGAELDPTEAHLVCGSWSTTCPTGRATAPVS